ncbi:AAA family ATPase [Fulvivirga sp. 1062]|uniref:AAA family ATPase n=2 Tax=Fulvivirga sedimenti TaxID=2879465 RepID=A0A9X1HPE0_9BACT|nr:AAA family ATPase [Fulvivirga sedimenti]
MSATLSHMLRKTFPFQPTDGQTRFFQIAERFLQSTHPRPVLLLKGYAGTGKTTLVSTLVQSLPYFSQKYVLMAPTGRAAKVMSKYAHRMAFTIHKRIYRQKLDGLGMSFEVQKSRTEHMVGIVDEASMIFEEKGFGSRGLLSDLFTYFFHQFAGNRLILIGDSAQLPPVGQELSPALNREYLEREMGAEVYEVELTEVMRQEEKSGILFNATMLRSVLAVKEQEIQFQTRGFSDIFRMTGERLEEGLRYAYDTYGVENSIIICRSNRSANQYNQYIRRQIHFYENELEAGEILMIVRNNYLFTPNEKGGFVANGDFAEVMKIVSFEEMHGLRYATLMLRLVDYPTEESFEAKVILDTLYEDTPSLSKEKEEALYQLVSEEYADIPSRRERREMIKKDPYLNALQVKFAYALTCHKSQGGQWNAVFVDQGYIKEEQSVEESYVRWLYTAVTRATDQLFLVNFHQNFFNSV